MAIIVSHTETPLSMPATLHSNVSLHLSPIKAEHRIAAMDILRGFALIGILMMNIEWFNRPMSELGSTAVLNGADHSVGWLIRCFVEGKFYKLFALLFGMGFAVMLNNAIQAGKSFGAWFARRMLLLFIFGMIHLVFLWEGDILHDYAFAGLTLLGFIMLLRTRPLQNYNHPSTFLKLGLWWLLLPQIITLFFGIGFGITHDNHKLSQQWQENQHVWNLVDTIESQSETDIVTLETKSNPLLTTSENEQLKSSTEQEARDIIQARQESKQEAAYELAALKDGNYWQATQFRAKQSLTHLAITPAFTFAILLPIFMLGYWLIASGIMANYRQHRILFIALRNIGLGVGLFMTISALLIFAHPITARVDLFDITADFLFSMGQYFMAAGYLGLLMALLIPFHECRWLHHLIPLGRMALTNYLMHSVILSSLFYGYAGDLYGEVGRAPQMLIVLAIFTIQIPLSRWWLTRYHFGPVEWAWRSLTYKRWQQFKIQDKSQ